MAYMYDMSAGLSSSWAISVVITVSYIPEPKPRTMRAAMKTPNGGANDRTRHPIESALAAICTTGNGGRVGQLAAEGGGGAERRAKRDHWTPKWWAMNDELIEDIKYLFGWSVWVRDAVASAWLTGGSGAGAGRAERGCGADGG